MGSPAPVPTATAPFKVVCPPHWKTTPRADILRKVKNQYSAKVDWDWIFTLDMLFTSNSKHLGGDPIDEKFERFVLDPNNWVVSDDPGSSTSVPSMKFRIPEDLGKSQPNATRKLNEKISLATECVKLLTIESSTPAVAGTSQQTKSAVTGSKTRRLAQPKNSSRGASGSP